MRRFYLKKFRIVPFILVPIVAMAWALDRVFCFNIMVRTRLDPQSFHRPYEPKDFIFGHIQSGISFEELKGLYSAESIRVHDEPLPGMNFKDVVIENCSHLKIKGKCEFTFFNDRLGKVIFTPFDEGAYESAAALLLGAKEIKPGGEYHLNKYIVLNKTLAPSSTSYFWRDKRYRDEELYFID